MNQRNRLNEHFSEAAKLLDVVRNDAAFMDAVQAAGVLMSESIAAGGKIIACGNGGSMSDAMHFAEELSGRYRDNRPALPAIACSDPSHITCVGNDYGFDQIFARYVQAIGRTGDVLVGISTSGNSANVIEAAKAARGMGISVIALTGRGGGSLSSLSDVVIDVPWEGYADRVQEVHIKVIHAWIDLIEQAR
jgi:D-sedoheptulose 7-phosphate isomerase